MHSRRRLRVLESEGKSTQGTIAKLVRTVEQKVEDAVVELVEDRTQEAEEDLCGTSTISAARYSLPPPSSTEAGPISPETTGVDSRLSAQGLSVGRPVERLHHRRRSSDIHVTSPLPLSSRHKLSSTHMRRSHEHSHNMPPDDRSGADVHDQPMLTPLQRRMIENLNALPRLRKEFVFFDSFWNTHAAIVCRDADTYAFRRRGEGVLRKIADEFEP